MIKWKSLYKQIPAGFRIKKNDYRVLWITEFPKDCRQLGESNFGEQKQVIINLNQPIKEAVHTFFHEYLHSWSYEYDANLTEKQVLALEKGLKDLIYLFDNFEKRKPNASNKKKRRSSKRIRQAR